MRDDPAMTMFIGIISGMFIVTLLIAWGVLAQAFIVDDCNRFGMFDFDGKQYSCTLIENETQKG